MALDDVLLDEDLLRVQPVLARARNRLEGSKIVKLALMWVATTQSDAII
jgi:hypothetical protein